MTIEGIEPDGQSERPSIWVDRQEYFLLERRLVRDDLSSSDRIKVRPRDYVIASIDVNNGVAVVRYAHHVCRDHVFEIYASRRDSVTTETLKAEYEKVLSEFNSGKSKK